jgi:hypothetical protein
VSLSQAGETGIAHGATPQDASQTKVLAITILKTPFLRLDVPGPPAFTSSRGSWPTLGAP